MERNEWRDRFQAIRARLLGLERGADPISDLETAVAEARDEWLTAQRFFECVSEPDLVDQAIYTIEAAERKYMYLLRLAKNQGVSVLH